MQKPVKTDIAEIYAGNSYDVITVPNNSDYALKLVCKNCHKEYKPGSVSAIITHGVKCNAKYPNHNMKTAVYQANCAVLGIGDDLESAVKDANQRLDQPVDLNTIEAPYGDDVENEIYYALITDSLAQEVEDRGIVAGYVRLPSDNVLISEEEAEELKGQIGFIQKQAKESFISILFY